MTDWKEPLGWIGEMVTGVPHSLTVAEAEEDASKGMYWPISGDDTIKANQGDPMTTPTPEAIEAAIIPGAAVDIEFLGNDEGCCCTYAELVTP